MSKHALKAIRNKCLNCCDIGTTLNEAKELVKECLATDCPLYEFRLGKDPYKKPYTLSEEDRERRKKNFCR